MAQWLEHWIFDQEVLGSNPVGVESFSAMPYFSSLRLSCRKTVLYPKLCYNELFYKEVQVYLSHYQNQYFESICGDYFLVNDCCSDVSQ